MWLFIGSVQQPITYSKTLPVSICRFIRRKLTIIYFSLKSVKIHIFYTYKSAKTNVGWPHQARAYKLPSPSSRDRIVNIGDRIDNGEAHVFSESRCRPFSWRFLRVSSVSSECLDGTSNKPPTSTLPIPTPGIVIGEERHASDVTDLGQNKTFQFSPEKKINIKNEIKLMRKL